LGQNIFLYLSLVSANEFFSTTDDVSLTDFVEDDPTKMFWLCSNLLMKSDMLAKAVLAVHHQALEGNKQFTIKPD
jgi:hypothetical protein